MQTFEENIHQLYGAKGKRWLKTLPTILETVKTKWQLTHIMPINNMNFHYVAITNYKHKKPF